MLIQIALALYPVCLASAAVFWTLRPRPTGWRDCFTRIAAGGSLATFAFLTGPWVLTSYWLRYVFLVLFAVAAIYSLRRCGPAGEADKTPVPALLAFLLFAMLDVAAIALTCPL